jgi:predicted DCC family thiol-disulfide oxidoreductase YuxK
MSAARPPEGGSHRSREAEAGLMSAAATVIAPGRTATPILLFDDECAVCRRMAQWVRWVARGPAGVPTIDVRAIGEDPEALRRLDPTLDIWKVYAKSHLLMPDGSILIAGEAVAEVLRRSPGMAWCAWLFSVRVFNLRPFQSLLDLGYVILSDVRPIFGCKSCGAPALWARPFVWLAKTVRRHGDGKASPAQRANFTPLPAGTAPKARPPAAL